MSYPGRVDYQWRSPVGLEDVLEESMSETSMEQQTPQHPIPTMQGAFEESMQETLEDAEESTLARKDSVYRRKVLLERPQYQRTVAGKWKQKAGEKYHPLWKLIAMLSFGMHLLHQELAKSDDEVIKILQGHVDEVDGFLERTTEDFDLAQHDINERIRYLQLPLEHGEVFDSMLMDRGFRTAMVDGNVKIEHIVDRTAVALVDSLKDVKKGSDGTKELARYLRRLDKTWHGRDDAITEVFQAMMGNTEGWAGAFEELQDKGKELNKSLEHLRAIIAEIQRLVGIASRRDVPQLYNPTAADDGRSRPMSRSMSPLRSQSPQEMINFVSTLDKRSASNEHWQEEDSEPELEPEPEPEPNTQWSRARTPPALHPNAILEEEDEYSYSPPRNHIQAQNTRNQNAIVEGNEYDTFPPRHLLADDRARNETRNLTDTGIAQGNETRFAAPGAAAGVAAGLGLIAAASHASAQENESTYPTSKPFGRSAYSPQPEIIEEEEEDDEEVEEDDEESDDSDYTIDIIDATPITSAPARAVAQDLNIRHDQSKSQPRQIETNETNLGDQTPDYTPPDIKFGSSVPKPTRDSIEESNKEFILPPLDLEPDTALPALTPLDYERMRANFTLPPFDLQVPEQYTNHKPPEVEQPKSLPHLFQDKGNKEQDLQQRSSEERTMEFEQPQQPPVMIPGRSSLESRIEDSSEESSKRLENSIVPQKPAPKLEQPPYKPDQIHESVTSSSNHFVSEPDQSQIASKSNGFAKEALVVDESPGTFDSWGDVVVPPMSKDLPPTNDAKIEAVPEPSAAPTSRARDSDLVAKTKLSKQDMLELDDESFTPLSQEFRSSVPHHFRDDTTDQSFEHEQNLSHRLSDRDGLPTDNAGVAAGTEAIDFASIEDSQSDLPHLTKYPRQLPIDNLLVRLRHGNGLITPTEAAHTISERVPEPDLSPTAQQMQDPRIQDPQIQARQTLEDTTPVSHKAVARFDTLTANEVQLQKSESRPIIAVPAAVPNLSSAEQQIQTKAQHLPLEVPKNQELQPQPKEAIETRPHHPTVIEPILRRRASYSDNRMTQKLAALQQLGFADRGLLSPESITVNPKHYPQSARVPSSGPWTFFSKDDMDHSYRHRRAHSLFSPATPYDLEWLLRRTPSDIAVSPMRWSEIYGFRSGHTSVVSPLGDPFDAPFTSFAPSNQDKSIASVMNTANGDKSKTAAAQLLHRPNSLQTELAIARGQLSQAAEVKPIPPSWKEPTARPQKGDKSAMRASSIYSKAPDLNSVYSPPGVPQIVRTDTGYASEYDDSLPSSAYTDVTFGQISPPPAISSAKPSPLHLVPRNRIASEPGSPSSPQEEPKFPAEISDEKHTVVEVPQVSPSLTSLVSATITGPEPDFPFLAATYGGPEPDYYYPPEEQGTHLMVADLEPAEPPRAEPSKAEQQQQQQAAPFFSQESTQPPSLGNFSAVYSQGSPPKKRDGPPPPLNFKLFPSTDSMSRGPASPRSPRPQDIMAESGRPMVPPLNAAPNISNSNLLALPPLAQEPMTIKDNPSIPAKTRRSPLKKLFKDALSPGLLASKLKRDKDKGHRRGRSSAENNLAKDATVAHAKLVSGHVPPHRQNGSVDTTTSSMRNGSLAGFSEGRRPSGERILFGAPGSDGRPF